MKKNLLIIIVIAIAYACSGKPKLEGHWVQPIEVNNESALQGFELNPDGTAQSINMATLVVEKWSKLGEDTLLLSGKSIGNGQTIEFTDTLKIEKLTKDSLIITSDIIKLKYVRCPAKH